MINDTDSIYDPTLYNEWWTFIAAMEIPAFSSDDSSRPIFYVSDWAPESVADFYKISKYCMFDPGSYQE
jgi:hypothetical protein